MGISKSTKRILAALVFTAGSFAAAIMVSGQQPQCPTCPIWAANAKYLQGVGMGYAATAGSGLTLNLAAGRNRCSNTMTNYAGGTLTLTNNTTNYVYLDTTASCAPTSNTSGYTGTAIALDTVVTSGGVITTITDDRVFGLAQVVGPGTITGGTCTNQVTTAISTSGVPTCTTVTPSYVNTSLTRRTCMIVVGADNAAAALANTDIAPQGRQCFIAEAATVVEVTVAADGGTPSVAPAKNHAGSLSDLVSSALATAGSGGIACSNTGGTTGIDGTTTCSSTLQNTSLSAGDWIDTHTATAGGTAKRMSISITWTVN